MPESSEQIGFIANDMVEVSPGCVVGVGLKEDYDPLNPAGAYELVPTAIMAKLTQAIQVLSRRLEALEGKK